MSCGFVGRIVPISRLFKKASVCSSYCCPSFSKNPTLVTSRRCILQMEQNSGCNLPDANHNTTRYPPTTRWLSYIPLCLTWIRIALIPLFMLVFYLPITNSYLLCLGIFLFASISDYLDGYLARKWNCTSLFGSFLDPVADKLLVTIALILLSANRGGILLPICTSIMVSREIFVSAWREWMTAMGKRESVSVGIWGKCKTMIQMITICLLLIENTFPLLNMATRMSCIIATVLSIYSALGYVLRKSPS